MYKYAQMKRFYHDSQFQVYMYVFMYVDPEIILVEDYFPDTKPFVVNYNKISTPVPVSKNWLGFSFIRLEDCDLYLNFDETELKKNQTTHPTMKLNYFAKTL